MFSGAPLTSFNINLSTLTLGTGMFSNCTSLPSFDSDLKSLIQGDHMFENCTYLTSFDSDLSNLIDGSYMFRYTPLISFTSDLSNLHDASCMFEGCKLDAESLANIIHTIFTHPETGNIVIGLGIDDTDEARQALAEAIWCKDWDEVN
jgi:hypothetical protein